MRDGCFWMNGFCKFVGSMSFTIRVSHIVVLLVQWIFLYGECMSPSLFTSSVKLV